MTVNVISDLHCRSKSFPHSFDVKKLAPADVLVVAGDLATSNNFTRIREKLEQSTEGMFREVIVVKGNHDYYDTSFSDYAESPSMHDNFVRTVSDFDNDVRIDFICSPLWTPIVNDELIKSNLNDYNYIPGFDTGVCTKLFWDNLEWIENEYAASQHLGNKTVIVTHHVPLVSLVSPRFNSSPINEAFCVMNAEAEKRIKALRPSLWVHGHSHEFMKVESDKTIYVRNPYGYEWKSHNYPDGKYKEDTGFVYDAVFEI